MRFGISVICAIVAASCASSSDVRVAPLDFGVVPPGSNTQLVLQLQNVGRGAAQLIKIERRGGAEGFAVTPGQVQLKPGERVEWKATFSSSVRGLSEARFAAVFDSGTTEFTLRARVGEPCAFAETFDVGDARVGNSVSRTITVTNPLDEPGEVYVGLPQSPFSVESGGTLKLAPHESREVTVVFAPQLAGAPRVSWLLRPSTDCTLTEVSLTGRAVEDPLSAIPGRLDFGTMAAGSARSLEVQVQNHTRSSLTLTAANTSTNAFSVSSQLPIVVPADGRASVEVEARALSADPFDAVLSFTTNSAEQPELRLPLLANRAIAACLTASASQLDFGVSEVGCRSHDARVIITNDCPHDVRLGDRTASPGFTFVSSTPQSVLKPGERVEFALSHAAEVVGESSGLLELSVDVLHGQQVLSVPLLGRGTPVVHFEEATVIPALVPPLDLLLVIDDSPVMQPAAASLERNLGNFALWADANGYDFRVGVMSTGTSPEQIGRLRRTSTGAGWLNQPTPAELNAHAAFRGLSTSRSSCLDALAAAFSAPLRNDPSELGGMLRPGAGLFVVCITNQRDGLQTAPIPTITSLLSLLPRHFALSVIASWVDVPGCTAELEHGPLTALAAHANGYREEICTPDWGIALEHIGRNYFGYPTNFFLQPRPAFARGPLRVFIDDVAIPEVDPDPRLQTRFWEYDGAANSVNFEPLYVPEPGKTLRFRYAPDCAR